MVTAREAAGEALPPAPRSPRMVALPHDAQELYRDERVAFFAAGEAFFVRWVDTPTMRQMQAMADVARPYEAVVPGGCGLFNLVVSGKANFSPEFRGRASEVSRDPTRFRRFRTHVILIDGLRAVTVQLFVNTFARLAGAPVPTTAVRSVEDSCSWAAPHLQGAGWTIEALQRVHAQVLDESS